MHRTTCLATPAHHDRGGPDRLGTLSRKRSAETQHLIQYNGNGVRTLSVPKHTSEQFPLPRQSRRVLKEQNLTENHPRLKSLWGLALTVLWVRVVRFSLLAPIPRRGPDGHLRSSCLYLQVSLPYPGSKSGSPLSLLFRPTQLPLTRLCHRSAGHEGRCQGGCQRRLYSGAMCGVVVSRHVCSAHQLKQAVPAASIEYTTPSTMVTRVYGRGPTIGPEGEVS